MKRLLRIGTRGSKLALAQATLVKNLLEKVHPGLICDLVILKTSGDDFTAWKEKNPQTKPAASQQAVVRHPLAAATGVVVKGLFVKEIEEALLEGKVEMAVHSVKDLQADLPAGLKLGAILKREDPRDAVVMKAGKSLKDLPQGSSVGASSLRRQAQIKRLRRDLELVSIRGNVDTRLRKLDAGECSAIVVAAAGLHRLGLAKRISELLDVAQMLPSPGQGALGIEIREADADVAKFVEAVNDPNSEWEVKAERSLLKALGGGCQVPMGALARVQGEGLQMTGAVFSPDGLKMIRKEITGSKQSAEKLGTELASHLRAGGADRFLYGNWERKK